jgi:hypothetical protein
MKNCFLLSLSILNITLLFGQKSKDSIYQFKSDILQKCISDPNYYFKGGNASSDLALTGLYMDGLKLYDSARGTETYSIDENLKLQLRKAKPINPRKYILDQAKKTSILIFNEAHYNPRNRVFVTSLLDSLSAIGYSIFAAETFSNTPSFRETQSPSFATGYYSDQPQFGNMIRKAIKLGYTLLPYEDTTIKHVNREEEEAKNISNFLLKNPNSKIIIYCGYDHIYETPIGKDSIRCMVSFLKELTHIDPLTVDQVYLRERSIANLERPERQFLHADDYTLFKDEDTKITKLKYTDVALFTPDTKFKFNRPSWIFENGMVPMYLPKNKVRVSYPIIVKVYLESDNTKDAIPIDVLEIDSKSEFGKTAFGVFPNSKYRIVIQNQQNEIESLLMRKGN